MSGLAYLIVRRRVAWVVLLACLVASVAILATGGSQTSTATGATAALPVGAQSTTVVELQERLPESQTAPALVVFSRTTPLRSTGTCGRKACGLGGAAGSRWRCAAPVVSEDGTVAPSRCPGGEHDVLATADTVTSIRAIVTTELPEGLQAEVTGPAASPPTSPELRRGQHHSAARTVLVVRRCSSSRTAAPGSGSCRGRRGSRRPGGGRRGGAMSQITGIPVDDAALGILSVLVFGAGTDYALLLISRYRDELRLEPDRYVAMRRAGRRRRGDHRQRLHGDPGAAHAAALGDPDDARPRHACAVGVRGAGLRPCHAPRSPGGVRPPPVLALRASSRRHPITKAHGVVADRGGCRPSAAGRSSAVPSC